MNKNRIFYGDGDPVDPPAEPPVKQPVTTPPPSERTFKQEEVNRMMKQEKLKLQQQNETTVKQLEEYKNNYNLTAQQKDELEKQIEGLRTQHLTQEEQNRLAAEKQKKEHENQLKTVSSERDTWQNRYTQSTIERALTDAAVSNKAYSPSQITALLKAQSRIEPVVDDSGKQTGEYAVKVKLPSKDKDGKNVVLDLEVGAAVKMMRDQTGDYGNLFINDQAPGLGASANVGSMKGSGIPKDPEAYMKWRKDNGLVRSGI